VLQADGAHYRLWRFGLSSAQATLQTELDAEALARASFTRTWRHFFQPHLNLAWLPAQRVFLRIVRLPPGDPEELPAMLELQLEKISPLPVNQAVWSFQVLNDEAGLERTVVVLLAARQSVDEFLDRLEAARFTPDRLEVPILHQVSADPAATHTTRLYLQAENDQMIGLAAWWQEARLESLNLIRVPNRTEGATLLVDHLKRLAWAGEVQGWLQKSPSWELVIHPDESPCWETALRTWSHNRCSIRHAPSPRDLAHLAANRTARRLTSANLVPPDRTARYQQQFVDRLWMRGLALLLGLYMLAVLAYAGSTQYYAYKAEQATQRVRSLAPAYTNAVILRERLRIVQEQASLKYAALDCLMAVSERLPHALTLEVFNFQGGNRLLIAGTVSADDQASVTEFNADLRKAIIAGRPLFEEDGVEAPRFSPRGRGDYRWDFTAKLNASWQE
jgi:hypothetical protein